MLSNIIEDERIESLLGDIYIGTKKRFDEYKVDIGASYKEKPKDPCGAILCVRFGREDLCPKEWRDEAKRALRDVKMTGKDGLLTTGERYVKKIVHPWLIENGYKIPIIYVSSGACGKNAKKFNDKCDHRMLGNETFEKKPPKEAKDLSACKKQGKKDVEEVVNNMEKQSRKLHEEPSTTWVFRLLFI